MIKKWITSAGLALCLLLVLLPANAEAAELVTGQWGSNLTWSYNPDTTTLTIRGEGMMESYSSRNDPGKLYTYEESITDVIIEDGVTSITSFAFSGWLKLFSVSLPNSLRVIGSYAFEDTKSLTELHIPDSVSYIDSHAFSGSALVKVNIPSSLVILNIGTFENCTSLETVTIPNDNQLTQIGGEAFLSCNNLTDFSIPKGVNEIGNGAFHNCSSLTSIVIPEGVTGIEQYTFAGCSNLTSIVLPKSLGGILFSNSGYIGESAFSECEKLTELTIPYGVATIERHAFNECKNLETVNLPGSVEELGSWCFRDCSKLTAINFGGAEWLWKSNGLPTNGNGLGLSNSNVINYLPGGRCGENICWSYNEGQNLMLIQGIAGYDSTDAVQRPDDDSENEWDQALANNPFIYIDWVSGPIKPDEFKNRTIHSCDTWDSDELPTGTVLHDINYTSRPSSKTICTKGGFTEGYSCEQNCSIPEILAPREFGPIGHDVVSYNRSATCVNIGLKFGVKCRRCNEILVQPLETPINSKNHKETEVICEEIIAQPTENSDGSKIVTYRCKDCSATYNQKEYILSGTTPDISGGYDPANPKTYTITFDLNGGATLGSTTKKTDYGYRLTALPANPTREDYAFNGWYTNPDGGTKITTVLTFHADTTVYANWVERTGNVFTITFDRNDGSDDTVFDVMATDANGMLSSVPATPSRTGYQFNGWYTAASGGEQVEIDLSTVFREDTVLYAHWTQEGGTVPDNPTDPDTPDPDQPTDPDNPNPGKPTDPDNPNPGKPTDPDNPNPDQPTDPDKPNPDQPTDPDNPTPDQPTDPDKPNPDQPTDPDKPTTPVTPTVTRYRIYTPGSTSGGSFSVSHSSAAQGTRITVTLSPRSNYTLDRLLATNLNTGRSIDLTRRYSDEYTFTMPSSDVEIELSFVSTYNSGTYYYFDIPSRAKPGPTAWYYRDRHIYHVTDGLVPDQTLITRDMLLSVLYNLTDDSLIPVESLGSETNAAQVWATNNGIMPDIYASGLWGLDRVLSREQTAMLVYGYAGYRGYDTSQTASLTHYSDYSRVRPIARTAMSWVLATGLLDSSSSLSPQATITCGQAGELFYRFVTTVAR